MYNFFGVKESSNNNGNNNYNNNKGRKYLNMVCKYFLNVFKVRIYIVVSLRLAL